VRQIKNLNSITKGISAVIIIGAFIAQMNDLISRHIFTSLLLLAVSIPQLYTAWEIYYKNDKKWNLTSIAMTILGVFCIISAISIYIIG